MTALCLLPCCTRVMEHSGWQSAACMTHGMFSPVVTHRPTSAVTTSHVRSWSTSSQPRTTCVGARRVTAVFERGTSAEVSVGSDSSHPLKGYTPGSENACQHSYLLRSNFDMWCYVAFDRGRLCPYSLSWQCLLCDPQRLHVTKLESSS